MTTSTGHVDRGQALGGERRARASAGRRPAPRGRRRGAGASPAKYWTTGLVGSPSPSMARRMRSLPSVRSRLAPDAGEHEPLEALGVVAGEGEEHPRAEAEADAVDRARRAAASSDQRLHRGVGLGVVGLVRGAVAEQVDGQRSRARRRRAGRASRCRPRCGRWTVAKPWTRTTGSVTVGTLPAPLAGLVGGQGEHEEHDDRRRSVTWWTQSKRVGQMNDAGCSWPTCEDGDGGGRRRRPASTGTRASHPRASAGRRARAAARHGRGQRSHEERGEERGHGHAPTTRRGSRGRSQRGRRRPGRRRRGGGRRRRRTTTSRGSSQHARPTESARARSTARCGAQSCRRPTAAPGPSGVTSQPAA